MKAFFLVAAMLLAPGAVAQTVLGSESPTLVFDARTGRILGHADPEAWLGWPQTRANELIGHEVVDRLHREVGEIRELVIDVDDKRISAVIIDRRDDWLAGEALVTVPIEWLSLPRDLGDKIALNYARERLQQ